MNCVKVFAAAHLITKDKKETTRFSCVVDTRL